MTRLSLLGTGIMGTPMALNLIEAGFEVTVWNRTAIKTAALVEAGATAAADPGAAVAEAEVVVTMLADGPAVDSVLFGPGAAAEALPPGGLLIDMSSIPPPAARRHAAALAERGVGYLDAPVSGGEVGAQQARLAIMAGGSSADFARAAPVFAALGRATHVGPAGSGQVAKLCNQAVVGITIGAVAEALLLAERAGADPAAVRAALLGGFADSRILELHGERMLQRRFQPGGKVSTQRKDMDTVVGFAGELALELPLSELVQGLYQSLEARGEGQLDHAALLLELEARNRRG